MSMAECWLEIAELDRARLRQWERGENHPRWAPRSNCGDALGKGLAGAAPTAARAG